jgi:hypothetical protein
LHNFPVNLTTDGSFPNGELILDSAGNLYGITHSGGIDLYGTVFEVSPQTGGTWTEQVIYSFDPTNANADGENPVGGLAFDSKGNLYGATFNEGGGAVTGDGGVFKLTPQSGGTWTEQLLHNFTGDYTPEDVAMDGIFPEAGVVIDASGNLYGTTSGGGVNGDGAFYIIGPEPLAATPIFSPAAGNYGSAQTITLTDATPGATIYYSNNGTPDTTSTLYSEPFTVSTSQTLAAFATATGYVDSNYTVARFTITPTVATPTFSPGASTYTSTQSVTISDSTSGATIYYTTDGTTPTTSSTKYTGAISVSSTETIEAIAVATGYASCAAASATYTISTVSPSFTLTNSGNLTIAAPGSTSGDTATITVTSTGGFSGTVNLSCSVTPVAGAIAPTCTLSSPTTTISGATTTQTTTLTVVTTASGNTAASQSRPPFWPAAGGAALALAFFFVPRRRRNLLLMVGLLAVIVSAAGLGCSGPQKKGSTGTTPGSYAVTVTGTAGTITETTTVNINLN